MKKYIILTLFLLSSISSWSQETFKFTPKWKVGETKTVQSKIISIKYENDKLKSQSEDTSHFELSVLSENETHYFITLRYDNIIFDDFRLSDEIFNAAFKNKHKIAIEFKVDKLSAESKAINWAKSSKKMKRCVIAILERINKDSEEEDLYDSESFSNYNTTLNSSDKLELFVGTDLADLLFPFCQKLELGKSIDFTDSTSSPFNKSQKWQASCQSTLVSVDKDRGVSNIKMIITPDMTDFKKMMAEMMNKFGKMSKAKMLA